MFPYNNLYHKTFVIKCQSILIHGLTLATRSHNLNCYYILTIDFGHYWNICQIMVLWTKRLAKLIMMLYHNTLHFSAIAQRFIVSQLRLLNIFEHNFCWFVKSRRHTRGTFVSALSNESFSQYRYVSKRLYTLVPSRSDL